MGSAWCRERAIASQASKSPLDRVIVQCVGQMYPCERATENGREDSNGVARDAPKPIVSPPMPMRSISHTTTRSNVSSGWQDVTLTVPESQSQPVTNNPVPPPRKKKMRRQEQERRREEKMGASSSPEPPMTQRCEDPEYCSGNSLVKPRPKNVSTVSLPNFSEWTGKTGGSTLRPPSRNLSSYSLSDRESSSLKSLKSSTAERLDSYMKKCRNFGSFQPNELVDKINQARDFSSDDEDHWGGLDDWDLGVIEHCETHDTGPPVEPTYRLHRRSRDGETTDEKIRNIIKPVNKTNNNAKDGKYIEPKGTKVKDDFDNDDISIMDTSSNISGDESPDLPEGTIKGNPFLDQGNNEDWFDNHYSPQEEYKDIQVKDTTKNTTNTDNNFKTFLYDFNRSVKSPPGSQTPKTTDTRSSAANKTPPPSPELRRDSEDFFNHEPHNDDNRGVDHSNLFKILREFKSLDSKDREKDAEKVLTDLGLPMSLREGENYRRIEDATVQSKVNGNVGTKDSKKPGLTLNIDGTNNISSAASDSSGRSSMTPSLSELEAALTDLLEASAAANVEALEANHPQPPAQPVPVHKQPLPTISISTVPSNVQES